MFYLISWNLSAQDCELLDIYMDNLIWDKKAENQRDFIRRNRILLFVDREQTYQDYKEEKEEYLSKQNRAYTIDWMTDFDEYFNYHVFNRLEPLTILGKATAYSQNCNEGEGILHLKMKIKFSTIEFEQASLYFKKVKSRWLFNFLLFNKNDGNWIHIESGSQGGN